MSSDLRELETTPVQKAFAVDLMSILSKHTVDGLETQAAIALTGQFLGKLIAMMPDGTDISSLDKVIVANINIGNAMAVECLKSEDSIGQVEGSA
jgi:hypothetical protein